MACTAWCTGQMLDGALHGVLAAGGVVVEVGVVVGAVHDRNRLYRTCVAIVLGLTSVLESVCLSTAWSK